MEIKGYIMINIKDGKVFTDLNGETEALDIKKTAEFYQKGMFNIAIEGKNYPMIDDNRDYQELKKILETHFPELLI